MQRVEDAGVGEIGQCQRAGDEMLTQKPPRKLRVIKQINNLNSSASQYLNISAHSGFYENALYKFTFTYLLYLLTQPSHYDAPISVYIVSRIYIRDLVTPVNEISGRSHLQSATL